MLSQSAFCGRVVNNDHFLYWGDIVKTNEEGVDFHIQVLMVIWAEGLWRDDKNDWSSFQFEESSGFQSIINSADKLAQDHFEKKHFFYLKFWSPWTTFTFIPGFNGILWTAFSFCFRVIEIRIYMSCYRINFTDNFYHYYYSDNIPFKVVEQTEFIDDASFQVPDWFWVRWK